MEMAQPTMTAPAPAPARAPAKSKRGCVTCLIITLVILLVLMFFCSCCSFMALSLAGAKGQAGTIIKPSAPTTSTGQTSGASLTIPTGLAAAAADKAINLKWDSVGSGIDKIRVYRSEKPDAGYAKLTELSKADIAYADSDVKKGTTYYYVITALGTSGAESGNSAKAAAVIDVPPLVKEGIYTWADVKAKADKDQDYLRVLTKVTGMTLADVTREVDLERSKGNIQATLNKGSIITNTMEDYRIVANFVLPNDRRVLCDFEGEVPRIMMKCGNPIKVHEPMTQTGLIVQQVQVFVTTVVMVMPAPVTNILINTGAAANGVVVGVLPDSILVDFGPDFSPPPSGVLVDPATFGEDLYDPDTDIQLDPGQQWIEQGKLLVTANPADPAPQETVTMTVKVFPAKAGVAVSYSVTGTDGYTASGTVNTDENGEITFTIPGGGASVADTVTVDIPSESLSGSVEYTF